MNVKKINWPLVIIPLLFSFFSIATLTSTAPVLVRSQVIFLVLGIAFYLLIVMSDYRVWGHYSKYLLIGSLALLLIVLVAGKAVFGSTRWLQIGSFSLQPSEFVKLSLVLYIPWLLSKTKNSAEDGKTLLKILALIIVCFGLVFIQPDLGTSIVILVSTAGILWYAGVKKIYFLICAAALGIFSAPVWGLLKPYQKERILVFINPTLDTLGAGYNVIQSTIAVGSGQLLGRGFGQGTQSHLQFLPVYWTDFIFAAFAEEWGFVGTFAVVGLYLLLFLVLLRVAMRARDSFGALLVFGIFLIFFFQFTVNVGMNLGLLPVTGIPLPLISYGGSSFLVSMALLGLAQSVWINSRD